MSMFNVKTDWWDVCKPPTVLLPGERGPQKRYRRLLAGCHSPLRRARTPSPPPPASQGLWSTRLQAWEWQSAAKSLVRELMLLQQHVPQRLCWCRRVETVRLQGLCVSDVGTHCLKSTENFPLKHVGMPPPASLLGGCYFWLWGYGK